MEPLTEPADPRDLNDLQKQVLAAKKELRRRGLPGGPALVALRFPLASRGNPWFPHGPPPCNRLVGGRGSGPVTVVADSTVR